jgi:hypothetical protein
MLFLKKSEGTFGDTPQDFLKATLVLGKVYFYIVQVEMECFHCHK